MALQYQHFAIQRVELLVYFWPELDAFMPGELGKLFGVLNSEDMFTSSEIRAGEGARFEGEHWLYDISMSSVQLRATGWDPRDGLTTPVKRLLDGTREFFPDRFVAFYTTQVRVAGEVPEEKDRDVGEAVMKKLLARVKAEDRTDLIGLTGAGLRLHGDTDAYHWHAAIEPPHPWYDSLYLTGELLFRRSAEPPRPGPDVDRICEQIEMAYNFVNEHVRAFASKAFK